MENERFVLPETIYVYYETHHGWQVSVSLKSLDEHQNGVLVGIYERKKVAKFRVDKSLEDVPQEDVLPPERPH